MIFSAALLAVLFVIAGEKSVDQKVLEGVYASCREAKWTRMNLRLADGKYELVYSAESFRGERRASGTYATSMRSLTLQGDPFGYVLWFPGSEKGHPVLRTVSAENRRAAAEEQNYEGLLIFAKGPEGSVEVEPPSCERLFAK